MTRYSVQFRDRIFVKGYGFLSLAKNKSKNIGRNISKNLSDKCRHKLLDNAKQSAADAVKTSSKRVIEKTVEPTDDLIGNKITEKITKVSKTLLQNNLEAVTNEHDKYIPKERYISPEERNKIIDDLRLI